MSEEMLSFIFERDILHSNMLGKFVVKVFCPAEYFRAFTMLMVLTINQLRAGMGSFPNLPVNTALPGLCLCLTSGAV